MKSLQLLSHTFMEIHIFESPRFYRFLRNRNAGEFISFFLKNTFSLTLLLETTAV